MQRKYADPPPQFAYIGRWCGFFMSLCGVALELIVAKSYLPTQSGIFQLAQFLSYSEIVEYRQSEETKKDFTHKYPGMIAGLKTFTDYLEKL